MKNQELLQHLEFVACADEGYELEFVALMDECKRRGINFQGTEFFDDDCPLCLWEKRQIVRNALTAEVGDFLH